MSSLHQRRRRPNTLVRFFSLVWFCVCSFCYFVAITNHIISTTSTSRITTTTTTLASSLSNDNIVDTTTTTTFTTTTSNSKRNSRQNIIFYNIYIPPAEKGEEAIDTALDIVKEQIEQVATGLWLANNQNDNNETIAGATLYYNTIGTTINATLIQSWCTNASFVAAATSAAATDTDTAAPPLLSFPTTFIFKCQFLKHYNHAFEEVTLNEVYQYCRRHTMKEEQQKNSTTYEQYHQQQQRVTYIHNKGSFHSSKNGNLDFQGNWRRAGTMGAIHKDCLDPPDSTCNMCSLLWQPFPFFHTSGNFWTADCQYVSKLIPPLEYASKYRSFLKKELMTLVKRNQMGFRLYNNKNNRLGRGSASHVGTYRFAMEAWISSHPDITPCDLSIDPVIGHWRKGIIIAPGQDNTNHNDNCSDNNNSNNNPSMNDNNILRWSMFPRMMRNTTTTTTTTTVATTTTTTADTNKSSTSSLSLPLLSSSESLEPLLEFLSTFQMVRHEDLQEIFVDDVLRTGEYFLLPGLLLRWHYLYNATPSLQDSWVWTTFPDGEFWKDAITKHDGNSRLALENITAMFANERGRKRQEQIIGRNKNNNIKTNNNDDVQFLYSIFISKG